MRLWRYKVARKDTQGEEPARCRRYEMKARPGESKSPPLLAAGKLGQAG